MELINQAQILLTLPESLFRRVMDSAYAHNRDPMDEFTYRLRQSFEIIADTPEESEQVIAKLFEKLKESLHAEGVSDDQG